DANGCTFIYPSNPVEIHEPPQPVVDVVSNQGPYCDQAPGGAINFTSPIAGVAFDWTITDDVGFGSSGHANILPFTGANPGTSIKTVTVHVIPSLGVCIGHENTFTITVNPTPTVGSVANQGPYCNTDSGSAINFSSPVAGASFNWTSSDDVGFG